VQPSWHGLLSRPGRWLSAARLSSSELGEWRNWQTRRIQVPVSARTWGFKSPLAHQLRRPAATLAAADVLEPASAESSHDSDGGSAMKARIAGTRLLESPTTERRSSRRRSMACTRLPLGNAGSADGRQGAPRRFSSDECPNLLSEPNSSPQASDQRCRCHQRRLSRSEHPSASREARAPT
jgi:hypothetical protein